jgi:hypothetical protein
VWQSDLWGKQAPVAMIEPYSPHLTIAGAFAISFPIVSLVSFVLAGTVAIAAEMSSDFADLAIWGFVALGLAVLSYFGHREKQRRRAEQQQRVR